MAIDGAIYYDVHENCIKMFAQGSWTNLTEGDYEKLSKKEW